MRIPLTPKEHMVLEYIKNFQTKKGYVPTYLEIKEKFDFASFFSVQRYLKQLETKGYLRSPWGNKKRAFEIVEAQSDDNTSIPFLGKVAAGKPIEAIERHEFVEVPSWMAKNGGEKFALEVVGQSMIDDGIREGDILVVQRQETAQNGQTVVALIDNEATVKRFFLRGKEVELRPANPEMEPIFVHADTVTLAGVVVGLIRKFR
ncbi:MAG: transcriptional repressor LexA [Oligoflexia bacterium]|nr:transcriptional repressor LexA [Oligoflexia bacterium]